MEFNSAASSTKLNFWWWWPRAQTRKQSLFVGHTQGAEKTIGIIPTRFPPTDCRQCGGGGPHPDYQRVSECVGLRWFLRAEGQDMRWQVLLRRRRSPATLTRLPMAPSTCCLLARLFVLLAALAALAAAKSE